MSVYLARGITGGVVWGVGDLLSQMYSAHKESAARRARGEKRSGPRPSGAQMAAMVDQPSLLYAFLYGGAVGALMHHNYGVVFPKIFKKFAGSSSSCIGALFLQQFVFTPLILFGYYNCVTAARGGFEDPSFLELHYPKQKHDVKQIETHILGSVLPFPLICSWAIFGPLFIRLFFGGVTGRVEKFLFVSLFVPWTATICHSQREQLL